MDTQKVPRGMDKSMVVVGMPLSAIIQDQLENSYCPVATLSMGAELKGTSCMPEGEPALKSKKKTISEDDVLSGNFLRHSPLPLDKGYFPRWEGIICFGA